MMKRKLLLSSLLLLALFCICAQAQTGADDPPKREVGLHFTSLSFGTDRTEAGLGARFTYNLTKSFALEAEGDVLPHNSRFAGFRNGGRGLEGLFGVKAGKRFERFGIFGKARPGVISFTQGQGGFIQTGTSGTFPFRFETRRATHFAADLGGVLEFYPSRRIVARFDAGDTIIRYGRTTVNGLSTDGSGNTTIFPFPVNAETTHNFQFTAGVGFRF